MKYFLKPTILIPAIIAAWFFAGGVALATEPQSYPPDTPSATIYMFGREDCKYCRAEREFVEDYVRHVDRFIARSWYYDIVKDKDAKELFEKITKANNIPQISPLLLVGGRVIQGFATPETTGVLIIDGVSRALDGHDYSIEEYLSGGDVHKSGSGCSDDLNTTECAVDTSGQFIFDLPFYGVADLRSFSLFPLSAVLGFVDGFNPCAMWVLVTFLLILMQVGDKKKMWQVAGLFILAEAVMYYLILNVWYKTWDFIGLDTIVTPAIGVLAFGGGVYFLYRYFKDKGKLVCDISGFEYQRGIEGKIRKLVNSPLTIIAALGVVGIALSVNIIEFACSIGIPQAFTKILEINSLNFFVQQFYMLVYTFFYMVDDFVVFGLALWGFDKIHLSYKYSRFSSLIGGILMIILGIIMFFAPNLLVF
ncbi:MAG: glutaredoxin [Candidatus Yonathbacteria bacterium CG_4_10_14_3_um_filter_47_65]|uniref:Glutaredoxin n=2 Tax=Parcubacteria group TaxID=1794811 RepID=A0A2M8D7E1_9BACT|nr:MAG: hypothetical protein AUJ44_04570 [Candidatus Nomurabacteria bacterium CG1_02_47_685]PIP03507.1 MAG: glutaredoxin [Candidatus Yonathbacteria bacterium CG23_combo_of_CG06-09_8_20_14_all_46_18]PIQ33275.1 MAG: glutaredoxin [Candidatus Yonathbacteria bacterium CG17_big_fil_post_rev_8_21_14_2_50_46_19]PIX56112.1 MAG: glutaredoxin [Candidatus Yonathbacteria bacterium CG_4_10_14_3_um_filter_47_65]PIY57548.1 MAG: glutaredoxin [Candidatus Yonathbacteria bacterium CG_4_10_14_0_8_um_filter_47_645]